MTSVTTYWKKGFTLIEILIVIAILGIIMGAVYSVYLTHQKSAYTQQEVVDLQQNLRIAMDNISRDIRMAGMLVPATTSPIRSGFASYSTSITLNTASSRQIYARINDNPGPTVTAGSDTVTCTVESPDAVDIFTANPGNPVKIIRPLDCSQPVNTTFSVTDSNRDTPSLTLQRTDGESFISGDVINRGDMIIMTDASAPDPNTVKYKVVPSGTQVNGVPCPQNQSCLVRIANCQNADNICYTNGTAAIIAGYISGLNFSYIQDNGNETNNPADLTTVRAVRVTVTGQTSSSGSFLLGGPKTRQIESVVKIRNRRM